MKREEVKELIKIGFCQPKFYKRSVWLKAQKIMKFLVENTNGEVVLCNFGRGKGKYSTKSDIHNRVDYWACLWLCHTEQDVAIHDAAPALKEIAVEMGLSANSREVLIEFYQRFPNFKKNEKRI